jgi:hypothetical protein
MKSLAPRLLFALMLAARAASAVQFDEAKEIAIQAQGQQAHDGVAAVKAADAPSAPGECDWRKTYGPAPDLSAPLPPTGAASRITGRAFPSVFEAWHGADSLNQEPFAGQIPLPDAAPVQGAPNPANVARHDLAFFSPGSMGLKPINGCPGLSVGFTAASVVAARSRREQILAANPDAVVLAEIRWHDARADYLPAKSAWWKAGDPHQDLKGDDRLLDWSNPDFQKQVALQCKAAVQTGVFDGCMFDRWTEDKGVIELARKVRAAIGEDALIVVNANNRQPSATAAYINGIYMEGFNSDFWPSDSEGWSALEKNLEWAQQSLHAPRITALEAWATESRGDLKDLQLMRAVTALALTRSDGYVLFGDKNTDGVNDHRHDWYPFWDKGLGRPSGDAKTMPDGSVQREFANGTAVYNPVANKKTVTVRFSEKRVSRATHKAAEKHDVNAGDGDIFLK